MIYDQTYVIIQFGTYVNALFNFRVYVTERVQLPIYIT